MILVLFQLELIINQVHVLLQQGQIEEYLPAIGKLVVELEMLIALCG
jgi:hypothetical protein